MTAAKIGGILLLTLTVSSSVPGIHALGNRDDVGRAREVEVSGQVRLIGSSPMTSLVITGEEREWHVDPEGREKLIGLQHRRVTVRAREYYDDLFFANGLPAGRRYHLRGITLVRVGD